MSSIIHPIHTVGQKCRPKHQVLVLKCYPKYQKGVQDVKPNSSELSYLLYYVSTRRSKLQKVGAFLEKKTASDVWRSKLGNVQVTLQILTATIEKTPRDLPLYSRSVLTILDSVLRSNDITMIEESIPTFETYCKYVDSSSLSADKGLSMQYQSIVQVYTHFGSKEHLANSKIAQNLPLKLRWRAAGLKAIKSVVSSDALGADPGKQLNMVMPVILENLYLDDGDDILISLQERAQMSEKIDIEVARRRRSSIATMTTIDTVDKNPAAASGTTADADRMAEDEVRVLAVRCLKQIFAAGTGSNRGQIRLATALTLRFIAMKGPSQMPSARLSTGAAKRGNWATSLIEAVARWTPVQDRFIIVVTAMETLVRSPIVEALLDKQLALATMIDWLLGSSINLIGLSVMDVLLGLIQHMLILLQLGGRDSKISPHHRQSEALDLFRDAKETFNQGSPVVRPEGSQEQTKKETKPSQLRQELLARLQKCIGNLATHIYYTDQISDMVAAILTRLKRSAQSESASAVGTTEDTTPGTLHRDPTADGFFSFATARVIALKAIKDILVTVNSRRSITGAAVEARSRVGLQIWEGTQWLLRDSDLGVRTAYADAFLTWLKLETNRNDLHLPRDGPRKLKHAKKGTHENGEVRLTKRTTSGASRKESKPSRSTFLQLLHLAIYDNALESPENDFDIALLHLLLTNLVERLGVNSVRTGLPMMMKLQEVVLHEEVVETPKAKVNIASLVHGYLWALTEKFDFETTRTGNEIHAEISRRKRFSLWFEKIRIPAIPLDHLSPKSTTDQKRVTIPYDVVETIKPCLNVSDVVAEIAASYDNSLVTPATSPPASPGRVFSVPTLGFGYGYGLTPAAKPSPDDQLPQKVRDEMLSGWTREACIAAVEKESTKTASISGSKTGASSGLRRHLTVNGAEANGTTSGRDTPIAGQPDGAMGNSPSFGLTGGLGILQKLRRVSTNDGSPVPLTATSSRESTLRVTELKRALSGYQSGVRHASPLRRPLSRRNERADSSGSESMISYSGTDGHENNSMLDINAAADKAAEAKGRPVSSASKRDKAIAGSGQNTDAQTNTDPRLGDDVPPVPKIPSILNLPGTFPRDESPSRPAGSGLEEARGSEPTNVSPKSQKVADSEFATSSVTREGRTMRRGNSRPASRRGVASTNWGDDSGWGTEKVDLEKLLAKIQANGDVEAAEENDRSGKMMIKPPY